MLIVGKVPKQLLMKMFLTTVIGTIPGRLPFGHTNRCFVTKEFLLKP